MDGKMIKRRIKAIRGLLKQKDVACLIVTKPANVTYLTGFLGDDSWAIVTKRNVYLLTDSRYIEQAKNESSECLIIERTADMSEAVAKLIKKLKSIQTITVEKNTTIAELGQLKRAVKVRFNSIDNIIESIRSRTSGDEVSTIKTAASIATKALKQTMPYIKPGITESELAGYLDFQIRKVGAINSFGTIVAFGPNASRPHHQPEIKRLKKNDTILIDFGAKYKGYCCDITRCFFIGKPTAFFQNVFDTVRQAQAAAIEMVKAGSRMKQVDEVAREVIRKNGLPVYGHGTGHGLGLEIHEVPFIKAQSKGQLEDGQVVTIEPGVYIPGKLGVRIEDDILVTKSGCRILTSNCVHSPILFNAL
jgi:Xaa-Pro aminopeptidase